MRSPPRNETGRSTPTDATFEERQRLPSWMGPTVLALSISPLAVTILVIIGENGVTPGSLAAIAAIVGPGLGVVPLVYWAKLRTQVRDDGVYFRFRPFHRSWRSIPFANIQRVRRDERRAFQYGIRWTRRGWEYRADANTGVEIDRIEGKPIFLGTERPHEFRAAIEAGVRRSGR
ncbi:hypothetical protein [Natrinema sp. 1APR25-10V2]|uniref:hypothetical protein n=1 Tax=Natrinema sp. 1APR25-10V2 TaxID=2951081 RepID=UPI002876099A|nr:hypothetical protein [Natrinema sp. 1APR25-10V2]MDS0477528.1 hypothetical protein [Natrinema sp. 1APR25-10V2]